MPLLEEIAAALAEYPSLPAPWRWRSGNSLQAVGVLRTLVATQNRTAAREALEYLLQLRADAGAAPLVGVQQLEQGTRLRGLLSAAALREEVRCYQSNAAFYESAMAGLPPALIPGGLAGLKASANQELAALQASQNPVTNHRRDYLWALYNAAHSAVAPIRITNIQSQTDVPQRLHPRTTRIVFRYDDRTYATITGSGGFFPKTQSPEEYQRSQGFYYPWHPYAYFRVRALDNAAPRPPTIRIGNLADNDTASVVSVAVAPQDGLRFPLVSEQATPRLVDDVRLYILEVPDDRDMVIDTGAELTAARLANNMPAYAPYLSGELGLTDAPAATILAHCDVRRRRAQLTDESVITVDQVTYHHVRNPTDVTAYAAWRALIENRRLEFHPNGGWNRYFDVHELFAPAYPRFPGMARVLDGFFLDTSPFLVMVNGTSVNAVDRYGRNCTVTRSPAGHFSIARR